MTLTSVPPGKYELKQWRVGYHHNDAYTAYLDLGAPAQLTRDQEKILRDASRGEPDSGQTIIIGANGKLDKTLPLHENEVVLVELIRVPGQ